MREKIAPSAFGECNLYFDALIGVNVRGIATP